MTLGTTTAPLVEAITAALPGVRLMTDEETTVGYSHDHAHFVDVGTPLAVAFPTTTAEVATLCRLAYEHRVPMVPRGAGTGLSGGAAAIEGSLVICLEPMGAILEIDEANAVAVVQPAVLNGDLARKVAEHGLFYPPDPGSRDISSIGGNVATNAGGLCCVKYGVTRDYIIGLEVVLPDGRTTRLGRRTRKGVAGLDLTGLFVGSEGTLGIVTEVTVRLLRGSPAARSTFVAEFDSTEAAGRAVQTIMAGCVPSMLEIMDATTLDALKSWRNIEFSPGASAVLIGQSDASTADSRGADMALMEHAAQEAGATTAVSTDDPREGDKIVAMRRLAGTALEQLGSVLVEDAAVPVTKLATFLAGIDEIAAQGDVRVAVVGHAGDGNMHPCIIFDAADPAARANAHRAFEQIAQLSLELGGTITGEHGVGSLKADLLLTELSDVAIDLHHAIKSAIDPLGLMNPGKILPLR